MTTTIIGIDLGTTNSCVAIHGNGEKPKVLPSKNGSQTIPSVVAFTDTDVIVGEPARRQMVTNPTRTIFGTKRLIGRKVNADDVTSFARTAPFRIVAAPNGDAWVRVDSKPKPPQEIASHVIRELQKVAQDNLGQLVTRAVVTVPAYFNDAQRQATKDAGTIAGVEVVRILNEPTAAALAYGLHRTSETRKTIVVFDLGGGTFDISIMAVENGVFEVLATNGDCELGGEDWDRRLIEKLVDEAFDEHRIDLTSHPVAIGRLKEAAEAAKKELSATQKANIQLPYLIQAEGKDVHLERTITRDELEKLTKDLNERLDAPCKQAMQDANLTSADIDEVLLVGGMTRSPGIQNKVFEIFGKQPSKGVNPDEAVALGAATHAAILSGEMDEAVLLDVTPHSIGIKVGDSGFSRVIPRNSMLPVREKKLFATTAEDQEFVAIELYQGESESVSDNRKLGEVKLSGLPKGPVGSVRIELIITIDVESILRVSARELKTGKHAEITIKTTGGLSKNEIARILAERRADAKNVEAT